MSEQQFADAVGVSRGAVQQWEKPGGTAPKRLNQPRVAKVLGLSVSELVSGGSNLRQGHEMRPEVPIVSAIEAGNYTVIDNFNIKCKFDTVSVSVEVKRRTYALRVHGDCMVSATGDSFSEGCVIVVEPQLDALPGDYVVALDQDNEITFKQLIHDGGDRYLKPLNARYPIKLLGDAKIIGVVREFSKRFR